MMTTVRSLRTQLALVLSLLCACGSESEPGTATNESQGSGVASTDSTSMSAGTAPTSTPAQVGSTTSGAATTTTTTMSAAGSSAAAANTGTSTNTAMAMGTDMAVDTAGAAAPNASSGTDPTMGSTGAMGAAMPSLATGTLPVPTSLDGPGPYDILDEPDTGPGNQFRLFAPQPLGAEGLKHPIVAWSPGAGAFPDAYLVFLQRLASHGFVTLSYNSTASGTNLVDAIDWLIAENERDGSVLYGMLDTSKVAAGGHSAGSLATYEMADDPRLTTTLHMSGGSFNPSTDVPRLRVPALMVCGDAGGDGLTTGDIANPMCIADFEMAKVPVFFAVVEGAGHTALNDAEATAGAGTAPDDPKKALFIKATIGWLRWQLAGDESLRGMFVGDDCELCKQGSGYIVKQKDLD